MNRLQDFSYNITVWFSDLTVYAIHVLWCEVVCCRLYESEERLKTTTPLFPELLNDRGLNSIVNELLAYNLIYNFIAMS